MQAYIKKSADLQHVLENLLELHRTLVGVLNEEYEHMASLDIKGLGEATHAKEVILAEIYNRESLRIKATQELVTSLGVADDGVTLVAIINRLPKDEAELLKNTREALMLLMTQAKESNARNMAFVENSLERIEIMKKNVLGLSNNSNRENYSNSGVCEPITEQGGRLLSTEA